MKYQLFICTIFSIVLTVQSFNVNSGNNVAAYWGQNGAAGGGKPYQTQIDTYCTDNTYDVIFVSFLNTFFSSENIIGTSIPAPGLNLANMCGSLYPGYSQLLQCPAVGSGIQTCQTKGKAVILSLGGAVGSYGFSSSAQAQQFATTVWNMFLGGNNPTYPRPFGAVQLDGVDLDLENGQSQYFDVFVQTLKNTYFANAPKKYYVTAAPQCVYPDASIGPNPGTALSTGLLDFINIQFYNNYCGLASGSSFNYNTWANWITANSPNTKIFIGAPADTYAAGSGYVTAQTLTNLVSTYINSPTFGGVMLWDISVAQGNIVSGSTTYGQYVSKYLKQAKPTTGGSTTSTTTSSTTTVKPTTGSTTSTTGTTTVKPTTGSTTSTTTVKPTTGSTTTTGTTTVKPTTGSTTSTTSSTTTVKPTTTTTTTGPSTTSTTGTTTSPSTLAFSQSVTSQWGSGSGITSQINGQVTNNGASSVSNPKFTSPQSSLISGMWGLESATVNGQIVWSLPSWSTTLAPGSSVSFGYAINSANPATFTRIA
ncbi:chitinase [Heterostelium album PN500]|uniref:chitinase n=1 Tax=Heterostelium pallidum (strain ATCC 26659 / Pp 5 / PN500) TaxID=670386 RepID=D3B9X8_HETP5|nr:chitinase [Heterostelium album PN500]EFA81365.1 chitinase [Heterostelium album PN500]|eukprot:XP_020433483.1 chitinase [Heterostelium album PN500]